MSQNRWNWKNTAASGLLLAAMGTGCGEETQTAVETDPIINGTVQNSNNYMVAVYHRTTDYEGPTPPAPEIWWPRPCTGTALTNRHILTATHCVTNDASWGAGAVALPASKFRLSTALSPGIVPVAANYTQTGSPPAGSITPQSIVVHPTADIAIIKTATTLTFPSGYKVPDIALEAVGTRSVRTVVSGYGRRSLTNGANSDDPRTETTALGAGTLRNGLSTTTATGNCTGGRLTLTPAADSTGATYHGDSGGPAFDFKPTIVVRIPGQCGPGGCPVRSFGTLGVMGVHHSGSNQFGCDDPTYSVLKWIQDNVGMGLRPSPIAQEVPDNYDLYVAGQDNATTTDLVIPAWPVGSSLAYDPTAGTLRNPSGLCLTDMSVSYPQLKTCTGANNQKWSTAALLIKNVGTGRCLDAADANHYIAGWDGNPSNRTKPHMSVCNGGPGQVWSWHF